MWHHPGCFIVRTISLRIVGPVSPRSRRVGSEWLGMQGAVAVGFKVAACDVALIRFRIKAVLARIVSTTNSFVALRMVGMLPLCLALGQHSIAVLCARDE